MNRQNKARLGAILYFSFDSVDRPRRSAWLGGVDIQRMSNDLNIFPGRLARDIAIQASFKPGSSARSVEGFRSIQEFEGDFLRVILSREEILGDATRGELDRSSQIALILSLLGTTKVSGELRSLARSRVGIGSLLDLFDEFDEALISPDQLDEIADFSPKGRDIARLYRARSVELARARSRDKGALRRALIEALKEEPDRITSSLIGRFDRVILNGIYSFKLFRFELFRLIAQVKPVTLKAPAPDARRRAFGFLVENAMKFEALADQAGALEIEWALDEPDGSELSRARSRIFSIPIEATGASGDAEEDELAADGSVRIIESQSRYREIEEIALDLIEARRVSNIPFRAAALLARDIARYEPIISSVFGKHEIPYRLHSKMTLAQAPFSRAVLNLIESARNGNRRANVMKIVRSPYFARFEKTDSDALEAELIRARLSSASRSEWSRRLDKIARSRRGAVRSLSASARLIAELIRRIDRLGSSSRARAFFAELKKTLDWLGARSLQARRRELPASTRSLENLLGERDAASIRAWFDLIDEMSATWARLKIDGRSFSIDALGEIVLDALGSREFDMRSIGSSFFSEDVVLAIDPLGSIGSIGSLKFSRVYICGAHEDEFPASSAHGSILTSDEIDWFNRAIAEKIPPEESKLKLASKALSLPYERSRAESFLFYSLMLAARDRLTISYSARELDGSSIRRSRYVDDLLEALYPRSDDPRRQSRIERSEPLLIDKPSEPISDADVLASLSRDLFRSDSDRPGIAPISLEDRRIARFARNDAQWRALKSVVKRARVERDRSRALLFGLARDRAKIDRYSGAIGGGGDIALALARLGGWRYSPTALEEYGRCPFLYFCSRVLRLSAPEEMTFDPTALDLGSLAHRVAQRFYQGKIKSARIGATPQNLDREKKRVESILRDEVKRLRDSGAIGDERLSAMTIGAMENRLRLWVERAARERAEGLSWEPALVEALFETRSHRGSRPAFDPITIDLADGSKRYLVGAIDRVDIDRDRRAIRVVDYKNSRASGRYASLKKIDNMGERSFQIPVYLSFAIEWAERSAVFGEADASSIRELEGAYELLGAKKSANAMVSTSSRGKPLERLKEFLIAAPGAGASRFIGMVRAKIESIESGLYPVDPVDCSYCAFGSICRYQAPDEAEAEDGE